jgi:ferredoxin-NADP reductase
MVASTQLRPPSIIRSGAARFAEALATPLVPMDYIDLFDPLRSKSALRARVVEVRLETSDAATVLLRPGRGWAGHIPGQWVRVGVEVDGVRYWRPYSLTSAPRSDGLISITAKAVPNGTVSTHLVRHAQKGMLVHLEQASGEFVLPEQRPELALFVTAGSGITPVMGMLRHAVEEMDCPIVVHSAPTSHDVIFGDELRQLDQTNRIDLIERHTHGSGHLTAAEMAELVPDWAERETWACGPTGLLDTLEVLWSQRGLSHRLHVERFRPTILATADGAGGSVSFDQSGVTVETAPDMALLDAGEEAGVLMRSGCRMGICFGCVTPLRKGAVRDLRTGEITIADEGQPVLVQTCISAAAGICHLDV